MENQQRYATEEIHSYAIAQSLLRLAVYLHLTHIPFEESSPLAETAESLPIPAQDAK